MGTIQHHLKLWACCCWSARLALRRHQTPSNPLQGKPCTPLSILIAAARTLSLTACHGFVIMHGSCGGWSFVLVSAGRFLEGAGGPGKPGCGKGVDIWLGSCRMVGLGRFRLKPGAGFFNSLVGRFEAGARVSWRASPVGGAAGFSPCACRKNAAMRKVERGRKALPWGFGRGAKSYQT